MSIQPHLLEVNNLTVDFKTENENVRAVDDISFSLKKGGVLGIVGESGSGKSVTALSIMRLIQTPPGKIISGDINYYDPPGNKIDLSLLSPKNIQSFRGKKIAMIFQEPMTSLNPVYTCGNQIVEAIRQHQNVSKKKAKEKTIELFSEVLLPRPNDIFSSYPHQLSGGQKQRVMIAMALSNNPKILIADEPTTALDVTVQKTILDLMKNLQKKYGMSIIFITHDLGVIAEIANTVLVMYKGKIVERGKVEGIFKNPQHSYTKGLLACRPPLNIRLKKLPVINDFLENKNNVTIKGFTKELIISEKERKLKQREIFEKEPVLILKNIKTFFPVKKGVFGKPKNYIKAVNDISLNVYPGETLGLVGESGCGKTTLGRSILKLVNTNGGEILYNGKNIETISKNELRKLRKDLQIIFQDPYSSLNPRITVGSAIMEPMKVHRLYKNHRTGKLKVFELLEKVNLDKGYFYRYPHELSGGQRQRICIARALALNPKFIICDESVSALDVSIQAQVLNLLNDLKREYGFTYIFISHDLSVVKFMSDRMAVMKDGKIEEIGDADQIYNYPKSEYTQNLIRAIPRDVF